MTHAQMIALIQEQGPSMVARAVRLEAYAAVIREGWDITNWDITQCPGALLFARYERADLPPASCILCVNAPEATRATWQAVAPEATVLMRGQWAQA